MKKIVFIGLVLLLAIASFLYAFIQQTAANKARIWANEYEKIAIEARAIADKNAELARKEAIRANILRDSLRNCKGR
jgi:hypothetical protein